MGIDKKDLDQRQSSDWKQINDIPIPEDTSKKSLKPKTSSTSRLKTHHPTVEENKKETKTHTPYSKYFPSQKEKQKKVESSLKQFEYQASHLKIQEEDKNTSKKDLKNKYKKRIIELKKKYKTALNKMHSQNKDTVSNLKKQIQLLKKQKNKKNDLVHKSTILNLIKQKQELKKQLDSHPQPQDKMSLHEIKSQHFDEKIHMRSEYEKRVHQLRIQLEKEKEEIAQLFEEKTSQITQEYAQQISDLKNKHQKTLETLIDNHQQSYEVFKANRSRDIEEVQYEHKHIVDELHKNYKKTIAEIENSSSKRLIELKTEHEQHIQYLIKEMEAPLLNEKKRNEELIELYDKDTSLMKKDLVTLQSLTRVQKNDLERVIKENKVFVSRVSLLLKENQNMKEQNQTLQELSARLKVQIEEKTKQIVSLQKLNQHISQSLFAEKKMSLKENTLEKKCHPSRKLVADLHLY